MTSAPAKKPTMEFTFIDQTTVAQPESRHLIRKAVMKGKNAGRVLPARRRPVRDGVKATEMRSEHPREKSVAVREIQRARELVPQLPRQVGNEFLGIPYGNQVTWIDKKFSYAFLQLHVDFAFPQQLCVSSRKDLRWFEAYFQYEAFFHVWTASAQLAFTWVLGKQADDYQNKIAQHLLKAIHLINLDISSGGTISDGTIACVIMLCCSALLTDNIQQAKVHMDGLAQMIKLRGGISAMQAIETLAREAQLFDIALAFQFGRKPLLMEKTRPIDTIVPLPLSPSLIHGSPLLVRLEDATPALYEAASELLKLSDLFNICATETKMAARSFHTIILQVRYRLLDIAVPGATSLQDPIESAIHLGLCAFAMNFDVNYHPRAKLSKPLKAALNSPDFMANIDPDTHLWLLMMAAISPNNTDEFAWIAPRVVSLAAEYGCTEWSFARQILVRYPWVGLFHDEAASKYWEAIFTSYAKITLGDYADRLRAAAVKVHGPS